MIELVHQFDGMFVVVRTRGAGVHCGFVKELYGRRIVLEKARKVFRWRGANTLYELALHGASEEAYTRISEEIPLSCLLTVTEVIPCTEIARVNLMKSRWLE